MREIAAVVIVRVLVLPMALITGFCPVPLRAQQGTLPIVAVHDSEYTRALSTMPVVAPTPNYTGTQWWETDWNYFVMPDALKEAFRSDGTAFTVIGDSNVTAGLLLSNGAPKYPIIFSLSSEAISSAEIAQFTNYVAAGGFLFMSGSAFTRNTNGTSLGDFAFANQMGVHMVVPGLTNWGADYSLTRLFVHPLVSHIPDGSNTWRLPAYSEEVNWGVSPAHNYMNAHDSWQIAASTATVVARGDVYPYLTVQPYGKGYFIYIASFNPIVAHGGFGPGMYAYVILRNAVEWAFQTDNMPIPKLSPWPYQYNAAFIIRHDLEDFANEMADIELSAQVETSNGVRGDYYFCTGTVRQDMVGLGYNTNTVIQSMRTAMTSYGATISTHNGGLANASNPDLVDTNYDYWHWGPDEALNYTPSGYANGTNYALASVSNSFNDIESWLSGLMSPNLRTWVSPNFNSTREASYDIQAQLNCKIIGDQKISCFPHWTLSTQVPDKFYPMLTEPVSDWFVSGCLAQSLEPWHPPGVQTSASMHTGVDFYYNLGTLINFYSHTLSTGEGDAGPLTFDFINYCLNSTLHPNLWATNGIGIYEWWVARSNAQINVSYSTNGFQSTATFTISGSKNSNTSVELLTPPGPGFCGLSVLTNGVLAGTNSYRVVNNQLIKVRVGTSVTNVVINYFPQVPGARVYAENFDEVQAPALPTGWTTSSSGGDTNWVTEKSFADTLPNAIFVPDVPTVGVTSITSPPIVLPSGPCQMSFRNNYNLDPGPGGSGYDAGILLIKIGTNAFEDILAAGGIFVKGGYTGSVPTNTYSPIGGYQGWCNNSDGWITTVIDLPPAAEGQTVQFEWALGTDDGGAAVGWYIDTIAISNLTCESCLGGTNPPVLPAQSNYSLQVESLLTVTNTATDSNIVTYTLVGSPSGTQISQNGVITWTPSGTQSPSTNTITTVATDCTGLSATNSFQVIVYGTVTCATVPVFTENFDEVTAPALPTGWTTTATGIESNWITTTVTNNTPPNSAFVPDVTNIGLSELITPVISVPAGSSVLTFKNDYNLELNPGNSNDGYDGSVLEIKIGNGAFTDIVSAGGSFVTGGYNTVIDTNYGNPLAGRSAWSGNSGGFITTTVNLPSAVAGQSIQLRWGCGTDSSNAKVGWWIDTVSISNSICYVGPVLPTLTNQTVNELSTLVVTNTATEPGNPSVAFTYQLLSPPAGASISTNGIITWTPAQTQSPGTNTITTIVTDNSQPVNLSTTNSFQVIVKEVNEAPVLPVIGPQTVADETLLTVTNAATEPNIHATTTGYTLINPQAGMSINSGGVFNWIPSQTQSPSTNTVTVVVSNDDPYDTVNPVLKATNSFQVIVYGTVSCQYVVAFSQNFDGVTAPALPSGWTTTATGIESNWTTTTVSNNTPPNSAFVPDVTNIGLSELITPVISMPTGSCVLTFKNNYNLEVNTGNLNDAYDGGVLEIKIGTNAFTDMITAGGSFVTGGYNSVIDTNYGNPLAGRSAWSGNSGGFITTTVDLPSAASGQSVQLRWSCGTDNSNAKVGWWIDTIVISNQVCSSGPVLPTQASQTVNELNTLIVTNTATEAGNPLAAFTYQLVSPPSGATINSNGIISWTPSQTESPGTNTITTVVTDNSQPVNLSATNSFQVFVKEVNEAPTLPAVGTQTVNEQTLLSVTDTATETNIHAATTGYTLINPLPGMSISTNGIFTWTPIQNQSPGTDTVTVVVTNEDPYDLVNPSLTATNSFTVVVTEVNIAPVLPVVGTQTVKEQTLLSVTNTASEPNIHATTTGYGLVSPLAGMNISSSGIFTWTPSQSQSPGTNTVTVVVTNEDPYDLVNPNLTATNSFTVVVKEVNIAPVLPVIGTQTATVLSTLTVTNAATESNIHATTLGYALIGPPSGMSINGNGIITWTPNANQAGMSNLITTVVTNSDVYDPVNPELTATNNFRVVVNGIHNGPSLSPQANATINDMTTLVVTNTATDNDIPLTTLNYRLVNPPGGASIDTNGIFTWSPTAAQSPGTNLITTVVTDSATQPLSATNTFTVFVSAPGAAPAILSIGLTNNVATITWSATSGHTYRLQFMCSGQTNWTEVPVDITTTNDQTIASTTNVCESSQTEFYRIADKHVTVSQ